MSHLPLPSFTSRNARRKRGSRTSRLEWLEPRCVLAAPTLGAITDVVLYAGTSYHVALDGADADGDSLSYSATSSAAGLTPTITPSGNRSLKITVDSSGNSIHGTMTLQLFEDLAPKTTGRIIELAQANFYDNLSFHRVIKDFMIQGGDPLGDGTGGSGTDFDDEYNATLQFTGNGLLAMAKGADDTNDSQFFITSGANGPRYLDYNHTIFGFLTEGDTILQAIDNVATSGNAGNPAYKPLQTVTMSNVEVIQDRENGVLRLSAPRGTTGQAEVTVQVSDGHGGTATRTFRVTVLSDTQNAPPFLLPITPPQTTINTPITFTIPALDVGGDRIYYAAEVTPANEDIAVSVNSETGQVTLTPKNNVFGVFNLRVRVANSTAFADNVETGDAVDTQIVPFYVSPRAPTIVRLLPFSDTGSSGSDGITSLDNSSEGKRLWFRVSGLMTGTQVSLYADGQLVGQATATGESMDIPSNGNLKIADGVRPITVVQTLRNQPVVAGNLQTTVDLASPHSSPLSIRIDTAAPVFLSTTSGRATVERPFVYDLRTDDEANGGVTYRLVRGPEGLTLGATTGEIRWTPTGSQAGVHEVAVEAIDKAGNLGQTSFQLAVRQPPTLEPVAMQRVDQDQTLVVALRGSGEHLPLGYRLVSGPTGAEVDPVTGLLQWSPSAADGGRTHTAVVEVVDSAGATAQQEVSIQVRKITSQFAYSGDALSVSMATADPALAGKTLEYRFVGPAPEGMALDGATGLVSWSIPDTMLPQTLRVTVEALAVGSSTPTSQQVLVIQIVSAGNLASDVALDNLLVSSPALANDPVADLDLRFRLPAGPSAPAAAGAPGPADSSLFGFRLSTVGNRGDSSLVLAARNVPPSKDWDEPTPRKLEENAKPEHRVDAAPEPQPARVAQQDVPAATAVDWLVDELTGDRAPEASSSESDPDELAALAQAEVPETEEY